MIFINCGSYMYEVVALNALFTHANIFNLATSYSCKLHSSEPGACPGVWIGWLATQPDHQCILH